MKKHLLSALLLSSTVTLLSQDKTNTVKEYDDPVNPTGAYFNDVTTAVGGGGIGFRSTSWGDINNDGHQDLLTGGKLLLNNKNGTFTDITASAGITNPYYVSTFIDMNNDGKEDIVWLHMTSAYNTIYINNGNNTFTPVALTMGTPAFVFISTLSVADVNNDKYPDLFVGQLRDDANGGAALKNYFYLNNKNNGFTYKDIYPAGMGSSSAIPDSTKWETRGSMFNDYDLDGDMDLYVAIYRQEQDQLWKNDGNGNFKNVLQSKSPYIDYVPAVDWSDHGTGCDWADYDNDGDMDLLLPNFAHSVNYYQYGFGTTTIWRNDGHTETTFTNTKSTNGISWKESYAGAAWGDVNNDGLQDFYVTCFEWYTSTCLQSELYIQNTSHSFLKSTSTYGLNTAKGEADGSFVDYDHDGKLDLATGNAGYAFALYKNSTNSGNNWLQIDLESTSGNTMAIGAKVEVITTGGTFTQWQIPNHGALQSKGNRLFFGLGTNTTITSVKVTWPNATHTSEIFTGLSINNIYKLKEGGIVLGIESTLLKNNYSLVHAYPNPAIDELNFRYNVIETSPVSIELYSVLGEKTVVMDNSLNIRGEHTFTFNTKQYDLSPGVYTYCIFIGEKSQTGKVVIEK